MEETSIQGIRKRYPSACITRKWKDKKESTSAGFEPTRHYVNGFQEVHPRLNQYQAS